MRFFKIVGVTLAVIAVLNLIQVSAEMAIPDPVYACSDLPKDAPFDVKKKCGRA